MMKTTTKKMAKRKLQGGRGTMLTKVEARGRNRLGVLTMNTRGVGYKEGRRSGRIIIKTAEMNQNRNPYQGRS